VFHVPHREPAILTAKKQGRKSHLRPLFDVKFCKTMASAKSLTLLAGNLTAFMSEQLERIFGPGVHQRPGRRDLGRDHRSGGAPCWGADHQLFAALFFSRKAHTGRESPTSRRRAHMMQSIEQLEFCVSRKKNHPVQGRSAKCHVISKAPKSRSRMPGNSS
jgi:hypothetical protein